jgi:hypothetical protein
MRLTTVERERLTDSMLKIQSARATINDVDASKLPNAAEIDSCLGNADATLRMVLGYTPRPATAERPADSGT